MASPTRESTGHGTCGLYGSESAYTVTSAAPVLELLLSISSSLWVTQLFPGWAWVVSVCVLTLNLRSPSTGLQSSIKSSIPPNVNLLVRMTTWLLGDAALDRPLCYVRR
jgi:hypothetical protein